VLSTSAGAVPVYLISNNFVTGGTPVIPFNTGSVSWSWDGTSILTSTGSLSSEYHIGSVLAAAWIFSDSVTNLGIDTSAGTANAASYECIEGVFGAAVGANICGNYEFGLNLIDDSTTVWGAAPGFTSPGTDVSQTLVGDDTSLGLPRDISIYDMSLTSWDGTTLVIDNFTFTAKGGDPEPTGGGSMTFSIINPVPVPAAVYLFGSALGLLGWAQRGRKALSPT